MSYMQQQGAAKVAAKVAAKGAARGSRVPSGLSVLRIFSLKKKCLQSFAGGAAAAVDVTDVTMVFLLSLGLMMHIVSAPFAS